MIKKLPKTKVFSIKYLVLSILLVLCFNFIIPASSFAQKTIPFVIPRPGNLSTTVSASVGDFYLNISGYIAPFASIVLSSDGVYLRATVADEKGYFLLPEILVKEGFNHFCFDAVDFKRLGESYSCMNIPPIYGRRDIKDVFLPPTLGLSRTQIAAGASATAWGYSMPGATVTLHFGNVTFTTKADGTGYYQIVLKDVKAGVYQLYSTAVLNNNPSLQPAKKLTLKALSSWDQFIQWLLDLLKKIWLFFTSLSFGPLWLAIPILILIIILILKLWPDRFTSLYNNRIIIFFTKLFRKEKHPLHHSWMVGY